VLAYGSNTIEYNETLKKYSQEEETIENWFTTNLKEHAPEYGNYFTRAIFDLAKPFEPNVKQSFENLQDLRENTSRQAIRPYKRKLSFTRLGMLPNRTFGGLKRLQYWTRRKVFEGRKYRYYY
jgi:hypothetical protein